MMEDDEILDKLHDLAQLDIDASSAYQQAIEEVEDADIRQSFMLFKADHQKHVDNLSQLIRIRGGEAPKMSPDFKGYMMAGFTSIRSKMGTDGALKAMESNEKVTNDRYNDSLELDWPIDIRRQIEENYADERRHLQYIQQQLTVRT